VVGKSIGGRLSSTLDAAREAFAQRRSRSPR
jgi:hypothetical protein